MCAGVVPQQPPIRRAPAATSAGARAAKCSGDSGQTIAPSRSCGSPAFGRTAIGVFQDLNQAAAWCDRLVFMHGGRVAAAGPTAEVLTPETIEAVFGVQARVFFEPFSNALQVAFRSHDD